MIKNPAFKDYYIEDKPKCDPYSCALYESGCANNISPVLLAP